MLFFFLSQKLFFVISDKNIRIVYTVAKSIEKKVERGKLDSAFSSVFVRIFRFTFLMREKRNLFRINI